MDEKTIANIKFAITTTMIIIGGVVAYKIYNRFFGVTKETKEAEKLSAEIQAIPELSSDYNYVKDPNKKAQIFGGKSLHEITTDIHDAMYTLGVPSIAVDRTSLILSFSKIKSKRALGQLSSYYKLRYDSDMMVDLAKNLSDSITFNSKNTDLYNKILKNIKDLK